MKKKLQIFVSSTYTDLLVERQAAVEAILKSGNIPAGMELFTSGNESQLQTIMRWIDESDVYLLILGGRYGSIEKSSGISYTEIEYDYAISSKKPLFSIVITEKHLEEKVKIDGSSVLETENAAKYKLFKDKVLSNISSFFDGPKDIKLAIHETLQDFKERYVFSGWVPGNVIEKYENLIEENISLRSQLDQVKISQSIKDTQKKDSVLKNDSHDDFNDIYAYLEPIVIEYKLEDKTINTPALEMISLYKERMINGITNNYGMKEIDMVLFFNLMPKLAIYDLTENEAVSGVRYRRFFLTQKGKRFIAFLNTKMDTQKSKKKRT